MTRLLALLALLALALQPPPVPLTPAPGGPWLLDAPDTVYRLDADATADATGFIVAAPGVTLDLNGHELTYSARPAPFAEGFESGRAPGWTLPPAAAVRPNSSYLFGGQALRFTKLTAPAAALSPPITPPAAPWSYAAGCAVGAPGGTQNAAPFAVTLEVVRVSDGAALGSAVGGGWNADGPVARVRLTDLSPVRLRITVTPASAAPVTAEVDHVSLTSDGDTGVLAANEWHPPGWDNLPPGVADAARRVNGFTLRNGKLTQGPGRSRGGASVQALSLAGPLAVDGLAVTVAGDDHRAVNAGSNATPGPNDTRTVTNNRIAYAGDCDVSRRGSNLAALDLSRTAGALAVTGNTFEGFPQIGVILTGDGVNLTGPREIGGNTFRPRTVVTNGYGIVLVGVCNTTVHDNTVTTATGFGGISLDGYARDASDVVGIERNVVDVTGISLREYGDSVPPRAFRLRNNVDAMGAHRAVMVTDNRFTARTGRGGPKGAYGGRLSLTNPRGDVGGVEFAGNTFAAFVTTPDPGYWATAFGLDGLAPGINPTFRGERYESNDLALHVGGSDGDDLGEHGATFDGPTLARTGSPARAWHAVKVGYWRGAVDGVSLLNPKAEGAPLDIVFGQPGGALGLSLTGVTP